MVRVYCQGIDGLKGGSTQDRQVIVDCDPGSSSVSGFEGSVRSGAGIKEQGISGINCQRDVSVRVALVAGHPTVAFLPSCATVLRLIDISDSEAYSACLAGIECTGIQRIKHNLKDNQSVVKPGAGFEPVVAAVDRFPHTVTIGSRIECLRVSGVDLQ